MGTGLGDGLQCIRDRFDGAVVMVILASVSTASAA